MALHDFQLEGGFIELNVLLKLPALVPSGGGANTLIANGTVRVGADDVQILAATTLAIAP